MGNTRQPAVLYAPTSGTRQSLWSVSGTTISLVNASRVNRNEVWTKTDAGAVAVTTAATAGAVEDDTWISDGTTLSIKT